MVTCSTFASDLLDLMEIYMDLKLCLVENGEFKAFMSSSSYLHGLACHSKLASFVVT